MKYRPRHLLEYGLLCGFSAVVRLLPYRVALGAGWMLAAAAFYVFRWRVSAARRRIREVFGEQLDERTIRRIAWLSLRNMFFNGVELLRVPAMSRERLERHADSTAMEKVRAATGGEKGAILALPHMGNWDLAGISAAALGIPVFVIFADQRNPLFNRFIDRIRGCTGIETLSRDNRMLLRRVIRNLEQGKTLAIPADLRSRTPAPAIRFLGTQANLAGGAALFARRAGVPIYPVIIKRQGWTRHEWTICDPVRPDSSLDKHADRRRMTQLVADCFDRAIRRHPEQYFWYNKRWVLDPPDSGVSPR